VTNFVEVEVDKRTGQIRVVKAVTLGDCGTTINPDMLEGQLVGGLNRGIGYSTLEEASYDPKTGKLNCEGFYDSYKMTTAVEMPPLDKIETGFASTPMSQQARSGPKALAKRLLTLSPAQLPMLSTTLPESGLPSFRLPRLRL
jgi:CO/xanthine dehydrogenase Mo-binding subunit